MKTLMTILLCVCSIALMAQKNNDSVFGFRHFKIIHNGDSVDILVKSKPGEENIRKPLFFFCQGSLPIPLMIRYKKDNRDEIYNVFPFSQLDRLLTNYHIAIVGKPYIPLVVDEKNLNPDMTYSDSSGGFPIKYSERNLLSYYTDRNINVINFLRSLPFVSKTSLVVAGHSEGSAIAAKIAVLHPGVTALIYSGGNPLGRMMTIVARSRNDAAQLPGQTDSLFANWSGMMKKNARQVNGKSDTDQTTIEFSYPAPMEYLKQLKIPVLITFGTKDYGLINSVDFLRLELIRLGRTNFTFKEYQGLEHNFFELQPNGQPDYDKYNWDRVLDDWLSWLKK